MTTADVPVDGELRIGAIRLPAGRRIRAGHGSGGPVAWATIEPVPDAGRVWAALSEAHAQSGLVPVLLAGIGGDPERPWDRQEFRDPDDLTELDHLDAAELLRENWRQQTTEYDDYDEEDEEDEEYQDDYFARSIAQDVAPFSRRQFPGLAQAEDHQLSIGQFDQVLSGLGPARVGLVPAGRPADALPMLGWNDALVTAVPKAAVLRSWRIASVPGSCGSGSPSSASWRGGHRASWSQPSAWPQSSGRSAMNSAAPACTTSPASLRA